MAPSKQNSFFSHNIFIKFNQTSKKIKHDRQPSLIIGNSTIQNYFIIKSNASEIPMSLRYYSLNSSIMKLSIFAFYTLIFTFIASNVFGQKGNYLQLSHTITTETKAITGFDKIDISEDFEVFIRFSNDEEKIEIKANENLHALIQVEKIGTTLKIYTKSYSTSFNDRNSADEKLVAYITAKNLNEIKGDEDVIIKLEDKLNTDKLTIYLDEDSILKGHLDVETLKVNLDEDSLLDISGTANKMVIAANEDSMIKSFDFIVANLDIDLRGESEAKLTVNGDINLRASGESIFHYQGDGNFIRKRVRGESEVKTW